MENKNEKLKENAENLQRSMRITTDARFQVGKRLESRERFSFGTTIVLSLGLIFIPLLQLSKIELHYSPESLSAIQIFFAVAVLVYSVINSTSNHAIRHKEVTGCADDIKDLNRELKNYIASNNFEADKLKTFNDRYRSCLENTENHSDQDYFIVTHELRIKDESKEDLHWFTKLISHNMTKMFLKFMFYKQHFAPLLMVVFLGVVIFDILGYTKLLGFFTIKIN